MGNPGEKYAASLHNVGFQTLDVLASRLNENFKTDKERSLTVETRMAGKRVALCKPQTFMNDSGAAVAPLFRRYGIADIENVIVVHDELDLDPGRLKLKVGGGLAGHNGLRSLRDHLASTDFSRVRIGVGRPPGGSEGGAKYVLGRPPKAVWQDVEPTVFEAADALEMIVAEGMAPAMVRYNQK